MKCSEIISVLERLAPPSCACDWDNVGLLVGRRDKEVHRIRIALDADDAVVRQAVEEGADMLLTHHPMIFKPLKKINDDDFISRRVLALAASDISYYAMHTNFDGAPGCMADLAADRLGLAKRQVLEPMGELDGKPYGIGMVGELESPMTLQALALRVKEAFRLPFAAVYGDPEMKEIRRVALCPGSGGSMIALAKAAGAEAYVTGDIGHHEGIDSVAEGMAVIDGGHYGLEHIFIDFMAEYLERELGDRVEVRKTAISFPARLV